MTKVWILILVMLIKLKYCAIYVVFSGFLFSIVVYLVVLRMMWFCALHFRKKRMKLTKKALLLLRSLSKPSALLWGTKVPVVANIARTQWHLRLVNCAFSGFASLKIALFIQLLTNADDPLILLGHPLCSVVFYYFLYIPQKSRIILLSSHGSSLNWLWAVSITTMSALSYASL